MARSLQQCITYAMQVPTSRGSIKLWTVGERRADAVPMIYAWSRDCPLLHQNQSHSRLHN